MANHLWIKPFLQMLSFGIPSNELIQLLRPDLEDVFLGRVDRIFPPAVLA